MCFRVVTPLKRCYQKSEPCHFYRQRFGELDQTYASVLASTSFEPCLVKLKQVFAAAEKAMPQAPEGCRVCHYLYNI
jgi:hypothetical protein